MVSGCCCKEVYRFPNNVTYPWTPLVLALFLQQHPYFFVHLKIFLVLALLFLCNIASVAERTFEIVQKSR